VDAQVSQVSSMSHTGDTENRADVATRQKLRQHGVVRRLAGSRGGEDNLVRTVDARKRVVSMRPWPNVKAISLAKREETWRKTGAARCLAVHLNHVELEVPGMGQRHNPFALV
jgi:hypothetical protein